MRYLFKSLFIIVTLYIILTCICYILDRKHEVEYTIGNFNVKENFNLENRKHIYTFEVKNEDFKITFDVAKNFRKKEKVLADIKGYNDNCILPIFKNDEIIYDVMCKKGNTVYFNHSLDNKVVVNDVETYNPNKFSDSSDYIIKDINRIYKKNIHENHYLFVENYKGIILINNEINEIKLFDNDVYKKTLSTVVDKYYLVANYNEELTFKSFYLVNLINGKQKEIRSVNAISFDSYIQGVVDGDVYLYDLDNQTQYKIDLDTELVTKVAGNSNIKFYNGKWATMNLKSAMNKKTFEPYHTSKFTEYEKADKLINYYVYEKQKNSYNVYLISKNNLKQRTYLFNTTDINSVTYLDEYIYYKKDNMYYSYSNNGIKKIIENKEMIFNDSLKYGVYEK